jgi:C-terminal processing protease CtpA/Prc
MFMNALLALVVAAGSISSPAATDTTRDEPNRRYVSFGVAIAPVPESFRAIDYLEPDEGVALIRVSRGSVADVAKLKAGDIVLAINGKRVDETTLFATLRDVKKGEKFRVEFLRGKNWRETEAVF